MSEDWHYIDPEGYPPDDGERYLISVSFEWPATPDTLAEWDAYTDVANWDAKEKRWITWAGKQTGWIPYECEDRAEIYAWAEMPDPAE